MKNYNKDFDEKMDSIISNCFKSDEDQRMLEFSRHFLNRISVFELEGASIQLEPMDVKLFQYLILSIVLDWEKYQKSENIKSGQSV
jgi:hypothetical protein